MSFATVDIALVYVPKRLKGNISNLIEAVHGPVITAATARSGERQESALVETIEVIGLGGQSNDTQCQ